MNLDPVLLPAGYGFRAVAPSELLERNSLLDLCCFWEGPRRRGRPKYVIGVDVSDGIGQDRSVIEVLRCGTIEEPAEQVAEFASDSLPPSALAPIVHALGQYYRDADGIEACVAVECNNHGLSVQDTLQLHLGYGHFYIWEFYDARDEGARFSSKIGWYTTPRTRPMLLDKFYSAVTALDPITGQPDLVTHSAALHDELKDFQTEGALWEAAAARGAHDDHIMATAIANYVAWRHRGGESEPLEDRRRRRHEQQLHNAQANALKDQQRGGEPDWRNIPATTNEHDLGIGSTAEGADDVEDPDAALYDPRAHDE